MTDKGITLFMREGLFDYKTDFFEWEKIEAISHNQNSFRDKVFARGDLIIRLDHGVEYPFENINFPQKQAEKIQKYKTQFSVELPETSPSPITDDKMAIIAEALSEVVKEYMDKKTSETEEDEDY